MKTIQIEFGMEGKPKVFPETEVCLSGETIIFVMSSKNPLIHAVNLAFTDTNAKLFCCPGGTMGSRQHHCKIDLEETKDPYFPKGGVVWGISLEHKDDLPKTLKYTITPFVMNQLYEDGELDPFIIITKRP